MKKNLVLSLSIVVSIAAFCYCSCKRDSTSVPGSYVATRTAGRPSPYVGGARISATEAIDLIQAYRVESSQDPKPLLNPDGQNLNGFYIRREIFDTLITQNNCTGIRFYLAKHPGDGDRHYTLVVIGTRRAGLGSKKIINDDDPGSGVFETVDPCPTECGSFGDSTNH